MSNKESIKLHLGAFDKAIEGWINTDITPHIYVSKIPYAPLALNKLGILDQHRYEQHKNGIFKKLKRIDLTKPLPFHSDSVSAVFSCHVFEHLFPGEVDNLIKEIYRVLVPGGICRTVVPDLEKIVKIFDPKSPEAFLERMFEASCRSKVKDQHHTGFTRDSLIALFVKSGFPIVEVKQYKDGRCPDIDKLDNRPEESVFVEATK